MIIYYMRVHGKDYRGHILAWVYEYGNNPNGEIDHINHDCSDNRIKNLRVATSSENSRNSSIRKDNTSGFTGVQFSKKKNKWIAIIKIKNKTKYLGSYNKKEGAILVRKQANIKYGFHKNHGINKKELLTVSE